MLNKASTKYIDFLDKNITICDNVIIGMNSNVIKNINEPGIYVGNPLKKLN